MTMIDPNEMVRGLVFEVARGVWYVPALMANAYFIGERNEPWVLIDAGVPGSAPWFHAAAQYVYGDRKPEAIVLTHGHFDHVGALKELADAWNVPIYAHGLEWPYLDGRDDYPPPDPTVGGLMAQMSRVFPRSGINVSERLRSLPIDHSVPSSPGWRFLHTPGHSPGHISLFRDDDRVLIAGDAVITIDQQNPVKLVSQIREFYPPPRYFTPNWQQAYESVQKLADLRPDVVATGHGLPISGDDATRGLTHLVDTFWDRAPKNGRYLNTPALADAQGTYYTPPKPYDPVPIYAAGVALIAAGMFAMAKRAERDRQLTSQ